MAAFRRSGAGAGVLVVGTGGHPLLSGARTHVARDCREGLRQGLTTFRSRRQRELRAGRSSLPTRTRSTTSRASPTGFWPSNSPVDETTTQADRSGDGVRSI